MNEQEFEVIETRHFITLTERASGHSYRIPVSDAIVVSLAGPNWRTGDIIKLSAQQQKTLAELDARCRQMGDEAAVKETRLQNKLGCLLWIVLLAVLAIVVIWGIRKLGK
jgi:hypothetical protein